MKNKLWYVFLCMIMCFSFMNNVFALEFTTSLSVHENKNPVNKGEETTILVGIKSNEQIASCHIKVSSDSSLVLKKADGMIANGWMLAESGAKGYFVTNSLTAGPLTDGKNIMSFTYQVNDNGKVTFNLECAPTLDDTSGLATKEDSIDLKAIDISNDYTLSDIKVIGGTLNTPVSPNIDSYIIKLDSPKYGLQLTTKNPDYQDDIVVTTEDGTIITDLNNISFSASSGATQSMLNVNVANNKKYFFLVLYEQQNLDNSLSYLKINGENIYVNGQKDYTYNVSKDTKSVKIEAALKDSDNFKFEEAFENGYTNLTLAGARQDYPIIVEPKSNDLGADGAVYTITIIRDGDSSDAGGGESSKPSSSNIKPSSDRYNKGDDNTTTNPSTGGISMFLMAVILIASLVGSVFLYQKNIEGYSNK